MIHTAMPAAGPLRGCVRVPGDKSISHRAVLFSAMSDGACRLTGVLDSADVRATVGAIRALGVAVEPGHEGEMTVTGWGSVGPCPPSAPIDCGNSGTTARLLSGVIAGWDVGVTLVGDASLSRRPMARITGPLSMMGATLVTSEQGTLPMEVRGGGLRAVSFESPVASAQVKSAVLLAGVRARGRTVVTEPALSRDHTERLLPAFGIPVGHDAGARSCWLDGPGDLLATDVSVPGDPSSAAFLAGAAALVEGSEVVIADVALNPTRTGFVRVLRDMGVDIESSAESASGAEPVGPLSVRYTGGLRGVTVPAHVVPSLVDEVPLLAVVATQASGVTRFEGVGELRVKESDRLEAVTEGLTSLGAQAHCGADWLEIEGPTALHACELDSLGDHRLAMAWAVAALVADGAVTVTGWDAIDVSYPGFASDLASLGA